MWNRLESMPGKRNRRKVSTQTVIERGGGKFSEDLEMGEGLLMLTSCKRVEAGVRRWFREVGKVDHLRPNRTMQEIWDFSNCNMKFTLYSRYCPFVYASLGQTS